MDFLGRVGFSNDAELVEGVHLYLKKFGQIFLKIAIIIAEKKNSDNDF